MFHKIAHYKVIPVFNSVKYIMTKYFLFTYKFVLVFLITYLIFGTFFYIFITSKYYGIEGAFSAFLVGEGDRELWDLARSLMIPFQIIRGILLSTVLYPFYDQILTFTYKKRMLVIWGYITIVAGVASGLPAPGNLEGILFMKPVITLGIHFEIFCELLLQGFAFSLIFSKWVEINRH
ncbi:MAG: hypothetical protein JJT78_11445 [Leptospira sp.]|nr:hypothetical protein [Leptospira sp.]